MRFLFVLVSILVFSACSKKQEFDHRAHEMKKERADSNFDKLYEELDKEKDL